TSSDSTITAVRSLSSIAYWARFSPTGPPPSTTTSAVISRVDWAGELLSRAMSATVRRPAADVTGRTARTGRPDGPEGTVRRVHPLALSQHMSPHMGACAGSAPVDAMPGGGCGVPGAGRCVRGEGRGVRRAGGRARGDGGGAPCGSEGVRGEGVLRLEVLVEALGAALTAQAGHLPP